MAPSLLKGLAALALVAAVLFGVAALSARIAPGTDSDAPVVLVVLGAVLILCNRFAERRARDREYELVASAPGILAGAFPPRERSARERSEECMPLHKLMARDFLEDSRRTPSGTIRWAACGVAAVVASLFIAKAVWRVAAGSPSFAAVTAFPLATAFFVLVWLDMARGRRRALRHPWRAVPWDRYSPARLPSVVPTVPVLLIGLVPILLTYLVCISSPSWNTRFAATLCTLGWLSQAWERRYAADGPAMRFLEFVTRPLSKLIALAVRPAWRACSVFMWCLGAAGLGTLAASVTAPAASRASLEPWGVIAVQAVGVALMLALFLKHWRRPTDVKVVSAAELFQTHAGGSALEHRTTSLLRVGLFVATLAWLATEI
jgi:hypothetical protein